MRVPSYSINGIGALPGPMPPAEESSSERNKFGRPYPWYCSVGGSLFSDECAPPSVEQGNKEAEAWIEQKVKEGKIDPEIAQAGLERMRASVAADCAARPEDCANLDTFSESPTCATVFGPELCSSLKGNDNTLLYVLGGAAFILASIAALK